VGPAGAGAETAVAADRVYHTSRGVPRGPALTSCVLPPELGLTIDFAHAVAWPDPDPEATFEHVADVFLEPLRTVFSSPPRGAGQKLDQNTTGA
jgi:hypothetical protein